MVDEMEVSAPDQDAKKFWSSLPEGVAYLSQKCLPQGLGWGSSSEKSEHWGLNYSINPHQPIYIHWLGFAYILA